MSPRAKLAFALSLSVLVAGTAEAVPPELQSLEDAYNKKVAEVAAPAAQALASDLKKIAATFAASGNYKEAAATKSKAKGTLAFLDSLEISASSIVPLPLAEATTIGQVSYIDDTGILGRFVSQNARASWELRQIKPGTYDVSITYSVNHEELIDPLDSNDTEDAGGTLQIREDTKLQRSDGSANSITYEITSTGGWDTYRTEIIGSITLASASATIVFEALAPEPQGLMQLRDLHLTPQRDAPAESTPTDQSTEKLGSLKRAHEERKAAIIAPIATAFTAEITSLKKAAEAAGDQETVDRVSKALSNIGNTSQVAKPPSSPPITLAAVDDLKVQLAGTTAPTASKTYLSKLGPGGEGAITWQLPAARPETQFYEASIRQRATPSSGGRLVLTAGQNEISYYLARPSKEQTDAPTFEDTVLGTLEIPTSAAAIQLRIKSLDPDSNTLADLQSLTLQPLDDDFAAKNAIAKQDRIVREQLERSDNGWKTIKGATYSPSDTARANSFEVTTASGDTKKLFLYGIKSPPPKYGKSDEDIDEQVSTGALQLLDRGELESIGRKAMKLVEDTFASGNYVIYTRDEPVDGGILAIIATAGGSTLAIDLATEGLALDSYSYGNSYYPTSIHPDLDQKVYGRWIKESIDKAKSSKRGLWENRQ